MRNLIITLCIIVAGASFASAPEIKGEWIQGGLLSGKVPVGSKVKILGNDVYVTDKGEFVFGLGRDTANSVTITVESTDGKQNEYSYSVKQREYRVQKIEGVEQKYVAPPPEVSKRIKNDAALVWKARQKFDARHYFKSGFEWPAVGPITGVYGSQRVFNGVPKRPHFGLDIAGPVGQKVFAPASGVVVMTHDDLYYSGGTLIVNHGQGVSSTFIHLSKILVEEGQKINQGEPIAEIGATGRVTGPHLDWRINWLNQRLDPQLLLPPHPHSSSE